MSNMSNFYSAVRTVAEGHRMVAQGWALFEEAIASEGGEQGGSACCSNGGGYTFMDLSPV